jgi:hypothetical protein
MLLKYNVHLFSYKQFPKSQLCIWTYSIILPEATNANVCEYNAINNASYKLRLPSSEYNTLWVAQPVANVAMEVGMLKVWRWQEQGPHPCNHKRGDVHATVYRDK